MRPEVFVVVRIVMGGEGVFCTQSDHRTVCRGYETATVSWETNPVCLFQLLFCWHKPVFELTCATYPKHDKCSGLIQVSGSHWLHRGLRAFYFLIHPLEWFRFNVTYISTSKYNYSQNHVQCKFYALEVVASAFLSLIVKMSVLSFLPPDDWRLWLAGYVIVYVWWLRC